MIRENDPNRVTAVDVKQANDAYKAALISSTSAKEIQALFDDYIAKYTAFWSSRLH